MKDHIMITLKELGKLIFAVIGVLFIRHSIDTGEDWVVSGLYLFYLFYYIGTTFPKLLIFIFDPVGYIKNERNIWF